MGRGAGQHQPQTSIRGMGVTTNGITHNTPEPQNLDEYDRNQGYTQWDQLPILHTEYVFLMLSMCTFSFTAQDKPPLPAHVCCSKGSPNNDAYTDLLRLVLQAHDPSTSATKLLPLPLPIVSNASSP